LLLFLKLYRDGFLATRWLTLQIIGQLLIATAFAANPIVATYGLHIFTAWEIGMSDVPDARYRFYLKLYYVSAFVAYTATIVEASYSHYNFLSYSMAFFYIMLLFVAVSPLLAKSISRSYRLSKRNMELEEKVRQLERERIAYDLHDNLGQTFSTISLQAELAEKLISKDPTLAAEELEKIAENARGSLNLVREIVSNLREANLSQVLTDEAARLDLADISLHLQGAAITDAWPEMTRQVFAAVLKEAITNVIRHSGAKKVTVSFSEDENKARLIVQDDGQGMKGQQASHGLIGMEHRLQESGGKFAVTSSDKGVRLQAELGKETKIDNTLSGR
jgi:two-component system sensor histidine kinase DesK